MTATDPPITGQRYAETPEGRAVDELKPASPPPGRVPADDADASKTVMSRRPPWLPRTPGGPLAGTFRVAQVLATHAELAFDAFVESALMVDSEASAALGARSASAGVALPTGWQAAVIAVERPRVLVIDLRTPDFAADARASRVTFDLVPMSGGIRFQITHEGYPPELAEKLRRAWIAGVLAPLDRHFRAALPTAQAPALAKPEPVVAETRGAATSTDGAPAQGSRQGRARRRQ